jgi:hypothetical protein
VTLCHFSARNWENFGIYFSSVNSTYFASFWFTFIQNFDIKKMKRKHSSTQEVSSPWTWVTIGKEK